MKMRIRRCRRISGQAPAEQAREQAEKVFAGDYWDALKLDHVDDQDVANKIFDMAVNMGARPAGIYAQRAVNFLRAMQGIGTSWPPMA